MIYLSFEQFAKVISDSANEVNHWMYLTWERGGEEERKVWKSGDKLEIFAKLFIKELKLEENAIPRISLSVSFFYICIQKSNN